MKDAGTQDGETHDAGSTSDAAPQIETGTGPDTHTAEASGGNDVKPSGGDVWYAVLGPRLH